MFELIVEFFWCVWFAVVLELVVLKAYFWSIGR